MKNRVIVGLVAVLVVGAGAYAWLRGSQGGDATVAAAPASSASAAGGTPVSITTVVVQKKDVDVMLDATGTVMALNSVEVRPQIASTITKVQIKEGQFVNAGQPLYLHTAPNGYPERQDDWVNSGALLARMNLAVQLAANRLPGVTVNLDAILPLVADHAALVDAVDRLILGGRMSKETRKVILDQLADVPDQTAARALAIGLAIGGPEFQRQ